MRPIAQNGGIQHDQAYNGVTLGDFSLAGAVAAAAGPDAANDLAARFQTPPAAARPWVYWMWIDGNITREGITADLEAMQRAGIGGVIIMEVATGRRPARWRSAARPGVNCSNTRSPRPAGWGWK